MSILYSACTYKHFIGIRHQHITANNSLTMAALLVAFLNLNFLNLAFKSSLMVHMVKLEDYQWKHEMQANHGNIKLHVLYMVAAEYVRCV